MEYLNRVELTGVVGQCTIENIGGRMHARFSVATNYCYKDAEGTSVVETTWHQVSAWEDEHCSFKGLEKGAKVNLCGRIRTVRYTEPDGICRSFSEISAQTINVIL